MIIYGRKPALEYLINKKDQINQIYLLEGFNDQKILDLIQKTNFSVKYLNKKQIHELAKGNHQGIIIDVADKKISSLNELITDEPNLVVLLDHIEDPHNLGAIIRTCEAAGVKYVIIPKDRAAGIDGVVTKTSAGAINNTNVVMVSNLAQTIEKLKKVGYWVVGTTMQTDLCYSDHDYSGKTVIVIGNEGKGMSNIVSKACDFMVHIPMHGKINSLNASVAAGIVIFEAVKKK